MGLSAAIGYALGIVMLIHAVYSAYEYGQLPRSTAPDVKDHLPLDITLEILCSVVWLSLSLVIHSPELQPIQWRIWAGQTEREITKEPRTLDDGVPGNPFVGLDERTGFMDIRARRKEYASACEVSG